MEFVSYTHTQRVKESVGADIMLSDVPKAYPFGRGKGQSEDSVTVGKVSCPGDMMMSLCPMWRNPSIPSLADDATPNNGVSQVCRFLPSASAASRAEIPTEGKVNTSYCELRGSSFGSREKMLFAKGLEFLPGRERGRERRDRKSKNFCAGLSLSLARARSNPLLRSLGSAASASESLCLSFLPRYIKFLTMISPPKAVLRFILLLLQETDPTHTQKQGGVKWRESSLTLFLSLFPGGSHEAASIFHNVVLLRREREERESGLPEKRRSVA